VCSYITEKAEIFGSAKGPKGWFNVDTANVYFDHPFHAPLDHSLNIDFVNEADGATQRVAVEISGESALDLVQKIASGADAHPELRAAAAAAAKVPVG
jgi:hypothetical protein